MEILFPDFTRETLALALMVAALSGFIKGVVGFAMPLVLVSGLTLFITPELALAGLILPTLASNLVQSLRQGWSAAWETVRRFRVFLLAGAVTLVFSAQFVRTVPESLFYLVIGVPVTLFALMQLAGLRLHLSRQSVGVDTVVGGVAGIMGGMAGIWGPPTVTYLTALDTEKGDQMRIQGVIYGLGAVVLVGAHFGSGVLRSETLPFSLALILPAAIGMWLGGKVIDRIDQRTFRRATLIVLLLAGANLVRRGLF